MYLHMNMSKSICILYIHTNINTCIYIYIYASHVPAAWLPVRPAPKSTQKTPNLVTVARLSGMHTSLLSTSALLEISMKVKVGAFQDYNPVASMSIWDRV